MIVQAESDFWGGIWKKSQFQRYSNNIQSKILIQVFYFKDKNISLIFSNFGSKHKSLYLQPPEPLLRASFLKLNEVLEVFSESSLFYKGLDVRLPGCYVPSRDFQSKFLTQKFRVFLGFLRVDYTLTLLRKARDTFVCVDLLRKNNISIK